MRAFLPPCVSRRPDARADGRTNNPQFWPVTSHCQDTRVVARSPAIRRALAGRVEIRLPLVIAALGALIGCDLIAAVFVPSYGGWGVLDETAHAATGLIMLAAVGRVFEGRVVVAVLCASVLIDLDHVPAMLGSTFLTAGTPRPYTHSLATLVLCGLVAVVSRGATQRIALAVVAALCLHFLRDLAEPGGPGVSLLWPLSSRAFTVGYVWYAVVMLGLTAVALLRRVPPRAPVAERAVQASQDS